MTDNEQTVFWVLRQADELWLELWDIAKRGRLSHGVASAAVRGLRRKGLLVKRPLPGRLSRVEVSLARGGIR